MKFESSAKGLVRVLALAVLLPAAVVVGLVRRHLAPKEPSNAIVVLQPYRHAGTWVFDDSAVGLRREPFVAGVPAMIDALVRDVPGATNGFRLLVSATPFPGAQRRLEFLRGDQGGNYYHLDDPPMDGWLCPAMFRYFPKPPPRLHLRIEPLAGARGN